MKSRFVLGAVALSLTVSTAMAADLPASAPPPATVAVVADPFTPIATGITTVVDGVIVTPITAIATIFQPAPPPPAPVVARY